MYSRRHYKGIAEEPYLHYRFAHQMSFGFMYKTLLSKFGGNFLNLKEVLYTQK